MYLATVQHVSHFKVTKAPDFAAEVPFSLALGMAWWGYTSLESMLPIRAFCCLTTGSLLHRCQLQKCSQGFKGLEMAKIFFALHLEPRRELLADFFCCVVCCEFVLLVCFWFCLFDCLGFFSCLFLHVVSLPVKFCSKSWTTLSFLVAITLLME